VCSEALSRPATCSVNQKVIVSKGKPHLYGEIVKIGRPGKVTAQSRLPLLLPLQP